MTTWTNADTARLRILRDRAAAGFKKTAEDHELLRRATIEANWRIADQKPADHSNRTAGHSA